jgi:Phage capsid family.
MEIYANDIAFKHAAHADIFNNRDAGFEMLRSLYRASKPDHNGRKSASVNLTRAALTSSGLESQSFGSFPTARSYRYVADLFRRERLTEGNRVLVPSTGSITPAAAMTIEGDDKPEFVPDFEPQAVKLGKAAVFSKATDETVEDIPSFSNWLRTELARQLLVTVDHQLVNGDGTAPNVLGLLNWAPAIPTAASLKAAVSAVISAGFQPTAILMSPDDYVDAADADEANWSGTLYGLPVVATTAVTDGNPIVGDFFSATIFEKYGPRFEVTKHDQDDFIMNLVTARADTRFLLAVPAVAAFCIVDAA